jgi:PST family polysaccharide transporter
LKIKIIKKVTQILTLNTSKNALWLLIDKIIRLGIGLFVGILVARYLGPEFFGKWNYVIALIALMSALSTLGLDQILVKHLLEKTENEDVILGTAFWLRLTGSFACTLIGCLYLYVFKSDKELILLGLLTSANLWFQSFDVIDLKNQSLLLSKKTVLIKNSAFLLIAIVKLIIIYRGLSLMFLVLATLIEFFLGALGLVFNYGFEKVIKWKFNIKYCQLLFRQCWPLILSGVIIMLYMRLDQVMIGEILGDKFVGYYSISTRFTELWYFIPSIFVTSTFPSLINKNNEEGLVYKQACLKLLKILFLLSFSISIFFMFFSEPIIFHLYGDEYMSAVFTLKVSIWTGVFVFWGMAAGNFLVIENLSRHNFTKSIQGLVINIILNVILIPKYGINGAAIATLISQSYASYFYYAFYKETRHIFKLQTQSILIFK